MSDFEKVSDDLRGTVFAKGPPRNPLYEALAAGDTVFVPLNGRTANAVRVGAYKGTEWRGFRLSARRTVRDGVDGFIMWAEAR